MFSVFFHMSEFIMNVLFGIVERIAIGKRPTFVGEVHLTIMKPEHGWVVAAVGDQVFAEYRGKNILFRPKFSIMHETDAVKGLYFIRKTPSHEKVYISWKEAASDNFFKDIEALFKRVQKHEGRNV